MKQGGKHTGGFTIIETLIVLAITGILFTSAVALISGRQAKAEFETSINDTVQQIQGIINQVPSGDFTNEDSFTCAKSGVAAANGNYTIGLTQGADAGSEGQNSDCVFLGKVARFLTTDPSTNSNLITYDVAGLDLATYNSSTTDTGLTMANPLVVACVSSVNCGTTGGQPDTSSTSELENGLSVHSMQSIVSGVGANIGAFAVVSSQGTLSTTGGSTMYKSGPQNLTLVALPGTATNTTDAHAAASAINTALQSKTSPATNGITPTPNLQSINICLTSGSTSQSGLITISAQSLNVSVKIYGDTTC